ncbi:MAG: GyrI-like domain-containing protein [Candidatus Bathyarchaeia archaeon]
MVSIELKIERFKTMRTANVQSQAGNPEEDALGKILDYAATNGLTTKTNARLFGRNFYPTRQPEPHGYEYYLTIEEDVKPSREIVIRNIPEGLYATLRVKGVAEIPAGWQALFSMVESAGYKQVGVLRRVYGWVNAGFEEIVNWQQQSDPMDWVINLWLQLKE